MQTLRNDSFLPPILTAQADDRRLEAVKNKGLSVRMNIILFYVPYPSEQSALRSVKKLMSERMIACANSFKGGISVYRWKGRVQTTNEIYVLFKSTQKHRGRLKKRIAELHPYDIPCVLEIKTSSINAEFQKWVQAETQTANSKTTGQ